MKFLIPMKVEIKSIARLPDLAERMEWFFARWAFLILITLSVLLKLMNPAHAAQESRATASPVVQFQSLVTVPAGQTLTLGDLIDKDTAPETLLQALQKIQMGSRPSKGEKRVFTNAAIASALRAFANRDKWVFKIPTQTTVVLNQFEIKEETIKDLLIQQWKRLCEDCEFEITTLQLPVLPTTSVGQPWRLEKGLRLPKGQFSVKLFSAPQDQVEQLYWITGAMKFKKLVPVASRTLNSGDRLSESDISWEWRDMTFATDGVPAEKSLIGQKVRIVIPSGEILFFQRLEREKAVYRGEVVRALSGSGEWQVSLEAVTEQDGFVGDRVNLRNRQTNRIISGEVIARGEVRIE